MVTLWRGVVLGMIVLGTVGACGSYTTSDQAPSSDAATCSVPANQACSPAPLCGCKADENCLFVGSPTAPTTVCGKAGPSGLNGRCSTPADCGPGLTCSIVAGGTGICLPYCSGEGDCVGVCGNTATDPWKYCFASCDPRDVTACAPSGVCTFIKLGTSFTACRPAGTGVTGEPCSPGTVCAPGHVCDASMRCRQYCRIGVTGDCAGGKTCDKGNPEWTYGGNTYGACQL